MISFGWKVGGSSSPVNSPQGPSRLFRENQLVLSPEPRNPRAPARSQWSDHLGISTCPELRQALREGEEPDHSRAILYLQMLLIPTLAKCIQAAGEVQKHELLFQAEALKLPLVSEACTEAGRHNFGPISSLKFAHHSSSRMNHQKKHGEPRLFTLSNCHGQGLIYGGSQHLMLPVPDLRVPCGSQSERHISNRSPTAPIGVVPGPLRALGALPHSPLILHSSELNATSFPGVKCTQEVTPSLQMFCLCRTLLLPLGLSWLSTASPPRPSHMFWRRAAVFLQNHTPQLGRTVQGLALPTRHTWDLALGE